MTTRTDSSRTTLAILVVACALGGVAVLLSSWWIPASGSSNDIQQNASSRAFNQALLGDTLFTIDEAELSDPTLAQQVDESIFILDGNAHAIKRFDTSGTYQNDIGRGRGTGVGQIYSPRAFDVQGDDLYVVDDQEGRLQVFRIDGSYHSTIATDHDLRAISVSNDAVLGLNPYAESLFSEITGEGDRSFSFGSTVSEQTSNPVVRDGQVVADGELLLYAPFYAGHMFIFDTGKDELLRRVRTVDDFAFLGAAGADAQYRRPGWEIRTRDVSLAGDTIYLHTWHRDGDEVYSVVDRYSWPDGEYLDSFQLAGQMQSFHASESHYLLTDRNEAQVAAYERP